jgi:HSP20 family protein
VEVFEDENNYIFEFEVPGLEEKDIEISVENRILKVAGERKTEEKSENGFRSERRYGKFSRSFRLPETADSEKIAANLKSGILTITVPRKEESKPRKIDVKIV